jgi:TatD DNase family protein
LKVLNWELELAKKLDLPIIIHCREAQKYLLPVIRDWVASHPSPESKRKGVLHCFSADLPTAEQYLKMGFFIALGAYIGYPSSKALRGTIDNIPLDRLVVETDCPFLPPQKFRGRRNEPSYMLDTLTVLAEIKGLSLEEMSGRTTQNAKELFQVSI